MGLGLGSALPRRDRVLVTDRLSHGLLGDVTITSGRIIKDGA